MAELVELDGSSFEDIKTLFRSVFTQPPWNDDWSDEEQLDLELAAVVHNIDEDDPIPVVRDLLRDCGINDAVNMRVCHMVENDENYDHISTLDHQILIEAKLIVDFKEHNTPEKEMIRMAEDVFLTNTGKLFLKRAFRL